SPWKASYSQLSSYSPTCDQASASTRLSACRPVPTPAFRRATHSSDKRAPDRHGLSFGSARRGGALRPAPAAWTRPSAAVARRLTEGVEHRARVVREAGEVLAGQVAHRPVSVALHQMVGR